MDLQYQLLTLGSIKETKTVEISKFTEANLFPCCNSIYNENKKVFWTFCLCQRMERGVGGGHWEKRREREEEI